MTFSWILKFTLHSLHSSNILLLRPFYQKASSAFFLEEFSYANHNLLDFRLLAAAPLIPFICYWAAFGIVWYYVSFALIWVTSSILLAVMWFFSDVRTSQLLKVLSFPCFFFLFFSPKAILGRATQCDCTERGRTTRHLHCEWGEWRSVCVQSDSRQHCPPSSFGVWWPTPRGSYHPLSKYLATAIKAKLDLLPVL